jgi:hypothetical protein
VKSGVRASAGCAWHRSRKACYVGERRKLSNSGVGGREGEKTKDTNHKVGGRDLQPPQHIECFHKILNCGWG